MPRLSSDKNQDVAESLMPSVPEVVRASPNVIVLPDSGPLITLAYAGALDVLMKPLWPIKIVDRVLDEVTRNATPTSELIRLWVQEQNISILKTRTCDRYQELQAQKKESLRKSNLGELAIQEAMHDLALKDPETMGVFLFEDHKIARTTFLDPSNCRKVTTRSWLLFLEGKGLIPLASDIERRAITRGRQFSSIRFPPDT